MEPTEKPFIANAWRSALQVRNFRIKIAIGGSLLILCAVIAPIIFQFVEQRKGVVLNDHLLATLPAIDLSVWIFLILYSLIVVAVISIAINPNRFLMTLYGYVILTALRFMTLLLTPLEPPTNISILTDPFVEHLFYQQIITKDLFFSGHTSLLVLFTLMLPHGFVRKLLLAGSCAIAIMLLLQHAHYTVDILLAPAFSWLAFRSAKSVLKGPNNIIAA